jgi:hypothetical protein
LWKRPGSNPGPWYLAESYDHCTIRQVKERGICQRRLRVTVGVGWGGVGRVSGIKVARLREVRTWKCTKQLGLLMQGYLHLGQACQQMLG